MKPLFYSMAFALMFAFTSCGYESPKYKALKAQSDSIKVIQQSLEKDVKEYTYVFNHMGQSLNKIESKEADHIQQIKTKLNNEENAKVNDNIAKFNSILQSNQQEVDELKKQARHSAFRAAELQRNVDRITSLLHEETAKTTALQSEVATKDSILSVLTAQLRLSTSELNDTKKQLAAQAGLVAKYEDELFFGYYITGSKSELNQKKVLTKAGLCKTILFQEDVNKANFTKINILETTEIKLPTSVKGKILSSHPKSSYKFEKQGDDKVIQITNSEKFWSITKYLVIQ